MNSSMSPKRIALWFLICSVAVSAILGIIIVLAGTFSDLQIRIILTTLTISAASICALASGALWEKRRERFLSSSGAILAALAAVLVIAGIWTEAENSEFWKFAVSVSLLAVATAHACLLALARLAPRFAWTRVAASVAVYFLAGLFIYIIYFTPKGDTGVRIIGATSIIVAALTILTPIFHRLSRGDLDIVDGPVATKHQGLPATITCPRCGVAQVNSSDEIQCGNCGCRFKVTILDDSSPAS
jgi:ribosomal protein S27AE